MELEFWGASSIPYLTLPERPLGYLLLAIYFGLLLLAIYQRRRDINQLSRHQWGFTLLLVLLSIIGSQLFLISISSETQLPPLSSARNPEAYLAPFSFVAFIFAGATLNPFVALIVGFAGGFSRAMWQSHQLTDLFNYAFAGLIAALLIQQNYSGRLYSWLRNPIVAGVSCALFLLPLIGLGALVYADADASNLEALDLAISTTNAYIVPLLVQGLLGGIVVSLLLMGLPQLRLKRREIPSPLSHSLNTRLVATFLLFAILLSFLLIVIGFNLAIRLSTELVVDQMARDAQAVSSSIPSFRSQRQNLLVQASLMEELLSSNGEERQQILEQIFKAGPFFRSLILVDDSKEIIANYPEDLVSESLTKVENNAIEDALVNGAPFISSAQELEGVEYILSFVVPVIDNQGDVQAALVGRVPDVSLEELVVALQGTLGKGLGFILDEQNQVIGHPEPENLMKIWTPPASGRREIGNSDGLPGTAFEGLQGSTNARQLIYYLPGPDHPWSVVITVPYEVILEQALRIAAQLAIVLVGAMVLFGVLLLWLGRSITSPLTELAHASQEIAGGSLDTPINPQGDDEIGRLSLAFGQMQFSLKRRLDELSLLLDVSQDVSKSIDINQGMPSVLKGALRGTGAAGARVVVMNPSGRQPLAFGEGPASSTMADYDRQVMSLIRRQKELVLASPADVYGTLKNGKAPDFLPKALVALPLATKQRFQGIFWLSYRDAHQFDQTELSFLRTLSSQASVLVENARLFATAEGGRRRLAAVLSSTSDAVIVTDQTDRILLINPAMEGFFDIKASEVIGRSIKDSVKSQELIAALTTESEKTFNVEIPIEGGPVLNASSSTIFNNEGQAIGRVAVLHDITYLKEIDEMKSEFVATVSHDLRSPLTFMLGYATMMPMVGALEPKQEEYLHKIVGGIDQMSDLVDGLLDLGRLEAGVELTFNRVRPRDILDSVYQEYLQPARENGIQLLVKCDQDLPAINGDAPLIRQAVANYVSNAIKYAPNSGKVSLEASAKGGELIIAVRDKGPGISTKDQLRLFEKFYRIKTRENERIKGTGLGLALAKSIAERHGGRVWCESQAGQGSAFYISIPIETQSESNESLQLI